MSPSLLVTPNPQSLIPSHSSLLSNFRVQGTPRGLTLNLEPINLNPKSFDTRAVFAVQ